jgi:tetratricopeptide (TPR) repeat protein
MNNIKEFDDWCKLLAKETGLSYPLVFKPHLQQIKDKWNAFDDEIAEAINAVMVSLLQHGLTSQLIDFTELISAKMEDGKLLLLRLKMYVNCGIAFNMQNRLEESEKMYRQAIELAQPKIANPQQDDYNILASIHFNYARLEVSKGRKDIGELLKIAIDFFAKGGYQPGLASSLSLQAVLLPEDAYAERIDLFLEAAEINKELGMTNDYAMRLANVGVEFINLKDFEKGLEYLNRALDINLENGSPHHLGMNYYMLAEALFKRGDAHNAKTYCDNAIKEFDKANIKTYDAEIANLQAKIENQIIS